MSSSPAAAPTRARSVNGPLPQLLIGPGRLASPDVADPSPAAPRWLGFIFDPIVRAVFTHDVGRRLKGLKQAVETTDILRRSSLSF